MNSLFVITGYYFILFKTIGAFGDINTDFLHNERSVKVNYPFYFIYESSQRLTIGINIKNIANNVNTVVRFPQGIILTLKKSTSNRDLFYDISYGLAYSQEIWFYLDLKTNNGLCKSLTIFEGAKILYGTPYSTSTYKLENYLYTIEVDLMHQCADDNNNHVVVSSRKPAQSRITGMDNNSKIVTVTQRVNNNEDLDVVPRKPEMSSESPTQSQFPGKETNMRISNVPAQNYNINSSDLVTLKQEISLVSPAQSQFPGKENYWSKSNVSSLKKRTLPAPICCMQDKLYVCTSNQNRTGLYSWHHGDSNVIYTIGPLKANNTRFKMKLENFDNNTFIYYTLRTLSNTLTSVKNKIILFEKETEEYSTIIKYNHIKEIRFDCQSYLNITKFITIGCINTTSNNILIYDEIILNKTLQMDDNGTIMCCLLHRVINHNKDEGAIQRDTRKKTLFIYEYSPNFNPCDSEECKEPFSLQDWLPYIISTAIAIIILFLIICLYLKKVYCKNTRFIPEDTLELNTKPSTDVLYADLDHMTSPGIPAKSPEGHVQKQEYNEDSTYAEIIGVLKPAAKK